MILSLEWLREFVDISAEAKEYCDRMTATGSKVEGFEVLADDIKNVKVGRILTIEKHPDADKLLVTTVDVGEAEPRQIVTGAQNILVDMLVPVACAPAELPNGVKIKKGKLRGVESNGMFCSIEELNLTTHDMPGAPEDGILPITEACNPGDDVCEVLKLRDTAVEFEITPNRPDCLSVIGLARETAASFDTAAKYHTPVAPVGSGDISEYLSVEDTEGALCPRYSARVVKNVKIAPSPLWLRMRLRASGVRPINNIVDITNYVMLEYGQPMHAFDYSCLDGSKIIIRRAKQGEEFTSLDDIAHTLRDDMLVIADEKKAVALAGIMGGANSEIKDDTATVVFESACFDGPSVRITSRALGMRTESSGRFEKGLDAENTLPALERACELVEMLGAGEVVGGKIDLFPGKKSATVLNLNAARINEILGVNLTEEYMVEVLKSLEFTVEDGKVIVPSWRSDVECMNDLAEEVLRIYGYDTIQPTLFNAKVKTGRFTPRQEYRHRMANLLCSLGLNEIITFSFISPRWYDKIGLAADDTLRNSVVIRNPLGEDTSVMRTTLLPSLVDCLVRNGSTHGGRASLYEIAAVYRPKAENELPDEHLEVAIGTVGDGDFYRIKGICETVLSDAGISGVKYVAESENPTFHPGRCAKIIAADGEELGIVGELHPAVLEEWGLDVPAYAATLALEKLLAKANFDRAYKPLPKYPASTRDFAFICDDELESATVEAVLRKAGGKTVESVTLFDVYRGAQIGEGKKSMAYTVTMRAPDRTLTDDEADKVSSAMLDALESELKVALRK